MSYLGDFQLETTFDFKFTTVDNTGLPVTLASGVVEVYEDNSLTQITAADTLTLDFDGITGLHNCRIAATAANGFGVGQEYQVVISVGTINSISAVGYVVGSFSIENRAALMPTTNGRRLDVNATGEAGLDLDNTSGTIAAAQIATDAITAAKVADGTIDAATFAASAINATAIAANAITAAKIATDAITAAKIAAAAITASEAPNLDAAVSTRATPAQVNTEVVDALATDTYAEPGQEAPAATNTLAVKIGYLFKFLRNRLTQTATELKVYADDATTVDQKSTVSDDATTYDRGEIGTGP